jgi:hypothetical protein
LVFRGPCIIALAPRATFDAVIPVLSGFCSTPHGIVVLAARNAIAIFFASSPIDLFKPRLHRLWN